MAGQNSRFDGSSAAESAMATADNMFGDEEGSDELADDEEGEEEEQEEETGKEEQESR